MPMKKKILVIEDDPDISKTLHLSLKMEGFDVLIAKEGKQGLNMAKTESPNLLLLDLRLPGLPGEEICRELRKDPLYEKLPIIMLTAKDTDVDKVIGRVIGANYYMPKPFDMEELLSRIHALIG